MAKNAGDVILRDRMQFDLDAQGNRTTLYGRIDLSSYVNTVAREGLAIKQVYFQLRNSDLAATGTGFGNTGCFSSVAQFISGSTTSGTTGALKIYATTRAYENANEVAIGSPDVLCVQEWISQTGPAASGGTNDNGAAMVVEKYWYGPEDLHPEGYTVVSDLLIGVAADDWLSEATNTIELDIVLIAEPIKISTDRMNAILSQAQDL
tara:strand:- start:1007 stop:1627 length:621 start_codon:yes stop_codon:yes gene_type:complete